MILAEGQFQWPATTQTLIGVVGLLTIVSLIFTVAIQARKLFGRVPPINDELEKRDKALRKMIFASESHLKEQIVVERKRVDRLEELYREMQLDRERKWKELQDEYHGLDLKFATLTGRIEAALKKLEGK